MTPLRGLDGEVYAFAQGSLVVSGFGVNGKDGSRVSVNVPSSGRIPNGASVEREVPTNFAGSPSWCSTSILRTSPRRRGWQRASTRRSARHGTGARCGLHQGRRAVGCQSAHRFISQLEALEIEPGEAPARVIINSRTGTVVISSHVRVMPAAVAHGSLSVTITERQDVSQPNAFSNGDDRGDAAQRHRCAAGRCAHVRVQGRRQPG